MVENTQEFEVSLARVSTGKTPQTPEEWEMLAYDLKMLAAFA